MSQFFATLHDEMAPGPGGVDDALTVLAAVAHVGVPVDARLLATGLGWAAERVTEALRHAGPERLTPEQRAALAGDR